MKNNFGKYTIFNDNDGVVISTKGVCLVLPTKEEKALNNIKNEDDVTIFLQDYVRRLNQIQEHIKLLISL